MSRFIVRVYNHVLRKAYDMVIDALDADDAKRHAEYVLGFPTLDSRAYVVRVSPLS